MRHILPSVPYIYLWVNDLDALFVVHFAAKVVRTKLKYNSFLDVLIITFIVSLTDKPSLAFLLFSQKTEPFIYAHFCGN